MYCTSSSLVRWRLASVSSRSAAFSNWNFVSRSSSSSSSSLSPSSSSSSMASRTAAYRAVGVSVNLGATRPFSQMQHQLHTSSHDRCRKMVYHSFGQQQQQLRAYHSDMSAGHAPYGGDGGGGSLAGNNSVLTSGISSQRPQMRIGDLLKGLENRNFAVTDDYSVEDAIAHLVKEKLGSSLVTDDTGAVLGIFTARDLLKFINVHSPHNPNLLMHIKNASQGNHANLHECLHTTKITDVMTKREKLVYCSPNDSVKHCREIMFQLKIRNLPVLDGHRIRGIVTVKALADAYFNAADVGGKKSYMMNVIGRKGIPDTAKVSFLHSSNHADMMMMNVNGGAGGVTGEYIDLRSSRAVPAFLDLEVGAWALPHPFKHPSGVAIDRRNYGPFDLATDLSLSEDAYFAVRVKDPMFASCPTNHPNNFNIHNSNDNNDSNSDSDATGAMSDQDVYLPISTPKRDSQVYLCVADGVGSWRQFGVDPRQYPVTLVDNARRVVEAEFAYRSLMGSSPFDRDLDPIHPLDVMVDAWNVTSSEQVMGSCTMCVATLDKKLNQLHYSNVGDGGLIVLRRMADTAEGTAGYSLNVNSDKKGSRRAQSPWKVAYLSQQQMKSFNLPYQLGNNPRVKNEKPTIERTDSSKLSPEEAKKQKEEEEFWMYSPRNFESPADADTASIPIMPGDLIILATDGLFDNMDLDDVVQVVTQWEAEHFPSAMGTVDPSVSAHDTIQLLAQNLVNVAREVSLDAQRDGPFALLAKENDILWSGGMPDDTTVVVARVVRDNSTS